MFGVNGRSHGSIIPQSGELCSVTKNVLFHIDAFPFTPNPFQLKRECRSYPFGCQLASSDNDGSLVLLRSVTSV